MRILVVDDEAEIRRILRLVLENGGYEVVEAQEGMHAVEIFNYGCYLVGSSESDAFAYDDMLKNGKRIYCTATVLEYTT